MPFFLAIVILVILLLTELGRWFLIFGIVVFTLLSILLGMWCLFVVIGAIF